MSEVDVDRLIAAARKLVFAAEAYTSAFEFDPGDNGSDLHDELREALGMTEDEWRAGSEQYHEEKWAALRLRAYQR